MAKSEKQKQHAEKKRLRALVGTPCPDCGRPLVNVPRCNGETCILGFMLGGVQSHGDRSVF